MKTKIVLIMAVGFCAISLCAHSARAKIVTIEIEAEIDSVGDPFNFLGGNIKVGDIIKGSYSYDTSTPDSNPLSQAADYKYNKPPFGVSLSVGGFDFKTDPSNTDFTIEIVNNYPPLGDYLIRSYNNLPLPDGTFVGGISWHLSDPTGSVLSIDALPSTAPTLSDWQFNRLLISGPRRGESFSIVSHVISATVIPEPMTILLFGLGCLFLRKRKRL